jgi:hypothetical protein
MAADAAEDRVAAELAVAVEVVDVAEAEVEDEVEAAVEEAVEDAARDEVLDEVQGAVQGAAPGGAEGGVQDEAERLAEDSADCRVAQVDHCGADCRVDRVLVRGVLVRRVGSRAGEAPLAMVE